MVNLFGVYLFQGAQPRRVTQNAAGGWEGLFRWLEGSLDQAVTPSAVQGRTMGSAWSSELFGLPLADPLAVAGTLAAGVAVPMAFLAGALAPVVGSLLLGRVFCGWLCPMHLLLEINDGLRAWLRRNLGIRLHDLRFGWIVKYWVLGGGLAITAVAGIQILPQLYPPAVIAREVFLLVFYGALGWGVVLIGLILLLELLVSRRWWCRYVCPGGALWSLLGRFRVVRMTHHPDRCDDCAVCTRACPFGLNPMAGDPGLECDNCGLCARACSRHFAGQKPRALTYRLAWPVREGGQGTES